MLSTEELEIYRNELIRENRIGIKSIKIFQPIVVLNKRKTTGLLAKPTNSIKKPYWADQWMALSRNFNGRCRCASCGKFIFADTSDPECQRSAIAYREAGIIPDCTPETLKIQGAHITLIEDIRPGKIRLARKGSTFIVPLCKECNNPTKRLLRLKKMTTITPEIR